MDKEEEVAMSAPINGSAVKAATGKTPRCPRRIVLVEGGEQGEVSRVLAEYEGAQVSGKRLHQDLVRFADEHHGAAVAAEWLGPLGWTRFLWCKR